MTLSATTSLLIDLLIAVSAARAEVDRPISYLGVFTMAEVMLTMRPNARSRMPGM